MSIVRVKLVLFGVSAFVAGLGGGLYATVVGTALPKSFNALVGIVWLAIVVTWGVRSVIGAALAGMIFAIAPTRLSIILILVFFIVIGGLVTELAMRRMYRNVIGFLAMTVLVVFAFVGSGWLWDNVSNDDAVSVILVLMAMSAAGLLAFRAVRAGVLPMAARAGAAVVLLAVGVWASVQLTGLDLGESAAEVPTLLFGLGAIALVNEPRGVVYQIINRQRLRQFKQAEERDERERLAADAALTGAPA
jgi:signal transduction histidine kinase